MPASIAARRSSRARGRGVQDMTIGREGSSGKLWSCWRHQPPKERAVGTEPSQPAHARPDVRVGASRRACGLSRWYSDRTARVRARLALLAASRVAVLAPGSSAPPAPRRRSFISSRPRGAGGDFWFGRSKSLRGTPARAPAVAQGQRPRGLASRALTRQAPRTLPARLERIRASKPKIAPRTARPTRYERSAARGGGRGRSWC
jgi:hypothetical protein